MTYAYDPKLSFNVSLYFVSEEEMKKKKYIFTHDGHLKTWVSPSAIEAYPRTAMPQVIATYSNGDVFAVDWKNPENENAAIVALNMSTVSHRALDSCWYGNGERYVIHTSCKAWVVDVKSTYQVDKQTQNN